MLNNVLTLMAAATKYYLIIFIGIKFVRSAWVSEQQEQHLNSYLKYEKSSSFLIFNKVS